MGFGRPVSFVVAIPKGGAGKTPVTLLLAGAFGVARGGGVLAWDNNELRGTMNRAASITAPLRRCATSCKAVPHLVPEQVRHGDLSGYVRR
jgi:Mrp family chromosome partitioning ATPase